MPRVNRYFMPGYAWYMRRSRPVSQNPIGFIVSTLRFQRQGTMDSATSVYPCAKHHRCHKKEFLLKFPKDRQRWRHWLFEAKKRYGLCVLYYIVTSNHVHLLVRDRGMGEIATGMVALNGENTVILD